MEQPPRFERQVRLLMWLVVAAVAWVGLALVVATLWSSQPPAAGFDLELILEAGRRVTGGESPYDPALLTGPANLEAADLFYSYPPPVARAAALLVGVPSSISFVTLSVVAVLGFGVIVAVIARARPDVPVADVLVPTLAVLPLLLPVAVALDFGNVDVLYPLLYGAVLVGVLATGTGVRSAVAGGIALGLASVAKIGPASVGVWLAVRGVRERRAGGPARSWVLLVAAFLTGLVVMALSLVAGGDGPWRDYFRFVGVMSTADVLMDQNIAPAAQVAMALGLGAEAARILYFLVLFASIAAIVLAAAGIDDTLTSLGVAATASLVVLPITWYHYPPALIPFAVAAVVRSIGSPSCRPVLRLVAVAGMIASLAIALPAALWISVGLVLVAAWVSQPRGSAAAAPAPARALAS